MKYFALHNGHDSSVTAFDDGNIIMHFELERHFGIKHLPGVDFGNAIGDVVDLLLQKLNWKNEDISSIIFCGLQDWGGNWTNTEFKNIVKDRTYSKALTSPYTIWHSYWRGFLREFVGITHHVNHMAYSYYTSPYTKSILFSIDGKGDFGINCTYGIGNESRIDYLGNTSWDNPMKIPFANIGISYSLLGVLFPFLGLDPLACAGKAMGLSSYGQPVDQWRKFVKELLFPNNIDDYVSDVNSLSWVATKKNIHKIKSNISIDYEDPCCKDVQNLMATIQDEFEKYMVSSIKKLVDSYQIKSLCLSGGCALNCQSNSRLLKESRIDQIFIPPACSDSGLSMGAGLYYWHHILGNKFNGCFKNQAYLGDYLNFNQKSGFKKVFTKKLNEENILDLTVENLAKGKILGWVQGRSEVGPRALGNRSILCAPYPSEMKDKVNYKIKHREFWRPFAPVCLEEFVQDWFEINHSQPYMLECPIVKLNKAKLIPAVTHVDGTARIQTVNESDNLLLYKLLKKFYQRTGVPILMNTSFNDRNKPIVNDIETIIKLLIDTELDYVVIDDCFFGKIKLFL